MNTLNPTVPTDAGAVSSDSGSDSSSSVEDASASAAAPARGDAPDGCSGPRMRYPSTESFERDDGTIQGSASNFTETTARGLVPPPPAPGRAANGTAEEIWESMFASKHLMWGEEPTSSAVCARDYFASRGARDVLIPGLGYGRNAKPFVDAGMLVTGIEISASAIALARSALGLQFPIHHGSVTDMPYGDDGTSYDSIFCFGLAYLLDAPGRAKFFADCFRQLRPGGAMTFVLISKKAPMYGQGPKLGEDWYERAPGMPMYFYDEASVERELGAYGIVGVSEVDEPVAPGTTFPFYSVTCVKKS
jgi:SAM-dependent methyltransferase